MIMKLIRLINKILLRKMRKTRIWSALKAIKMSIFYQINRRYKVPDMSGIRRGDSLVKIRGLGKILMDKFPKSDILFLSATPIPRTLFMLKSNQMYLNIHM